MAKKKATKKKAAKRMPDKQPPAPGVLVTYDRSARVYMGRLSHPRGEALSWGRHARNNEGVCPSCGEVYED